MTSDRMAHSESVARCGAQVAKWRMPVAGCRIHPTDPTATKLVEKWAVLPLINQPDAAWRYGLAKGVLGRVIEVVSGQKLGDIFAERSFAPLGTVDSIP